ncbi:MAG: hypothetical protein U1E26_12695 [Coriobacteriia bacterium]|nr:hypothetical protein [Coriobacteriia bacterium]
MTLETPTTTLRVVLVGVAIAAAATLILGADNATPQDQESAAAMMESRDATSKPWPMNARGETFGITIENQEADLVRVVATNNRIGYSLATELSGPVPSSPEEALRWQAEQGGRSRFVPVYEADGVTQIGVFEIGGGTQVLEPAP